MQNKKVLVTGATGLIGSQLAQPLRQKGFDVHALTVNDANPNNGFKWIHANLFDTASISDIVKAIKPQYLLNLAWATTGDYLSSDLNYSFLTAGINLARAFAQNGGKRAVYAGTCFEYKFKDSPLRETDELDAEKTTYTFCKNALREISGRIFSAYGIEFGYGRVFYVYGRNEASTRLTASVIARLRKGENVEIKAGPLKKDYIYTKDIANAFVALLDSHVSGPVNICTGHAITIREYVTKIANKLNRTELLSFHDDFGNQPPVIEGDNTRLTKEVGYTPKYSLSDAITEILTEGSI